MEMPAHPVITHYICMAAWTRPLFLACCILNSVSVSEKMHIT